MYIDQEIEIYVEIYFKGKIKTEIKLNQQKYHLPKNIVRTGKKSCASSSL